MDVLAGPTDIVHATAKYTASVQRTDNCVILEIDQSIKLDQIRGDPRPLRVVP